MIGLCTHRESVMIESQIVQVFFPCQMSIVRKQNPRFSMRWTALNALCLFALLISLCAGIGSIENIVENLKVCPHPTLHNLCMDASSLHKNTFTQQGHSGRVLFTSSLKSWIWSWSQSADKHECSRTLWLEQPALQDDILQIWCSWWITILQTCSFCVMGVSFNYDVQSNCCQITIWNTHTSMQRSVGHNIAAVALIQ